MTGRPSIVFGLVAGLVAGGIAASARAEVSVPPEVLQAEQERIEVIARASQAAISVFGGGGSGGGSGVVISPDGYALSNFHVVKPAGDYMKCSMPDGQLYDAVVVGVDPTGDAALIQLLGRNDFPHAMLGDSDQLQVGQWCFAVGNPFLLATDFQPTVTCGIISGVHRYQHPAGTLLEYTDCIQTDASVNPGNSGGPLFNMQGELIGINGRCSFEKRGRVNVGVAYAISINQIKYFLGHLRSGRIVDHATLGAIVASDEEGRVVVTDILETSDAYRRGLRYHDELLSFSGRPIRSPNSFKNVLGIFPRGWRVPVSFRRDGQRFDRFVRLAGVHSPEALIAKVQSQRIAPPEPRPGPPRDPDQKPGPQPPPPRRDATPMPEHVAKRYEARRGYANYYYNRLNRDRIWQAQKQLGDFAPLTGPWTLEGDLADGRPVRVTLNQREVAATLGDSRSQVDLSSDLATQLSPDQSGGFLLALAMWRRFLTLGPDKYGEVYYLGTVPLPGQDDLVDALVATHDVVETHFLFDRQSGQLLAVEMFPDSHVDPCELYFEDYRDVESRAVPHQVTVRYGDTVFGQVQLRRFTWGTQGEG
jgi:S1-C subfamily serine protease